MINKFMTWYKTPIYASTNSGLKALVTLLAIIGIVTAFVHIPASLIIIGLLACFCLLMGVKTTKYGVTYNG